MKDVGPAFTFKGHLGLELLNLYIHWESSVMGTLTARAPDT
jgi:hypothetical protein